MGRCPILRRDCPNSDRPFLASDSVSVSQHSLPIVPSHRNVAEIADGLKSVCAIFFIHTSSFILHPSSFTLHPSPFTLHPSSLIPHPSSFTLHNSYFIVSSVIFVTARAELLREDVRNIIENGIFDCKLVAALEEERYANDD